MSAGVQWASRTPLVCLCIPHSLRHGGSIFLPAGSEFATGCATCILLRQCLERSSPFAPICTHFDQMLQIGVPWALPGTNSAAALCKQPGVAPLYRRSVTPITLVYQQKQKAKRGCPCFATLSTEVAGNMVRPFPPISSLKAILFDVDGTLTESDALHYLAFRELLLEEGYNGGEPITEEFYSTKISGGFNADLGRFLFPEWDLERQTKWMEGKEARFRQMAADKLVGKDGLAQFVKWIEKTGVRRAAVTNAPRLNAEQMIAACGLTDFFEYLVIGEECERAKPFPDPYLKGLELLGIPADQSVVFEDSTSGTAAAVEANLAVVGVISGNPEEDLLKAGVAFAITDFTDPKLWNAIGAPVPSIDD